MKNKRIAVWSLILLCVLNSPLSTAFAQGTAFTYQGRLNAGGVPANGVYDFQFGLWSAASGPAQLGSALTSAATAVSNGLFTVTLDFGANFPGADRWLDIAVRTNGSGSFVTLSPRQALTPSPYAIYANTASNVTPGSVVNSLNNLKDDVTLAAGTNVTITPNGNSLTIASAGSDIWSLNGANTYYSAGNVGIGTTNPQERLTIAGVTGHNNGLKITGSNSAGTGMALENTSPFGHKFDLLSGGAGDSIGVGAFGLFDETMATYRLSISPVGNVGIGVTTPIEQLTVGGESLADTKIGVHATGNNYAALRVANNSGSWLWQVTPSNDLPGGRMRLTDETIGTEPLSITHGGNVGIGTITPAHRLSLIGGPLWTTNSWTGALELGFGSAIGWRSDPAGQRFGLGVATGGLYVFHTASDPGTTGSPANYDLQVTDTGNVTQARDKSGLVKAMLYVNQDSTIARCYNGSTDSATGGCGFTISHPLGGNYIIDFGFKVDDRFISITPHGSGSADVGAMFFLGTTDGLTANQVTVRTFLTDVTYQNAAADAGFMIIVY